MSQKVWEINGVSLELDLEDAEVLERYENAFDLMREEEKAIKKDGKVSEFVREYCMLFRRLYDRIFFEGASEQIFAGQKWSVEVYHETYDSFLLFARGQVAALRTSLTKYAPNRSQRRAAAKKKK